MPGNQPDVIPSNHVCDSKCDCDTKEDDVIDRVAKAQVVWPGGELLIKRRRKILKVLVEAPGGSLFLLQTRIER